MIIEDAIWRTSAVPPPHVIGQHMQLEIETTCTPNLKSHKSLWKHTQWTPSDAQSEANGFQIHNVLSQNSQIETLADLAAAHTFVLRVMDRPNLRI